MPVTELFFTYEYLRVGWSLYRRMVSGHGPNSTHAQFYRDSLRRSIKRHFQLQGLYGGNNGKL